MMSFRLRTRVGPGNHILDGVQVPQWEGAVLKGKGRPIVQYRDTLQSSVQKRLNRSKCCLGFELGWAPGIVLVGGPDPPWEGEGTVHCKV